MIENSGLSCSYYVLEIFHPWDSERKPYTAECGEICEALELNPLEMNVFKEIWRKAAARQGKEKEGNNPLRSAEKIKFFAERIYISEAR